jgi:Uma2 family endonuclease
MNAPVKLKTFTNAEFERIARTGGFGRARVELRGGMIVEMSPQHVPHASAKRLLSKAIEAGLERAGLPWIVDQEVSVAFMEGFEPMPDIVVWNPADAPANLDGPIPGTAVKLVVEVSDTSLADDLGDKLAEYARAGLAEYWVADIKGKFLLRHDGPSANGYARREPLRFGESAQSLTVSALNVDTSALA